MKTLKRNCVYIGSLCSLTHNCSDQRHFMWKKYAVWWNPDSTLYSTLSFLLYWLILKKIHLKCSILEMLTVMANKFCALKTISHFSLVVHSRRNKHVTYWRTHKVAAPFFISIPQYLCCKCVVGEMYLSCHIIQAKISPYHCWKSFLIFLLCVQYACFKITAPFSLNGTPSNRSVSSVPKGNVPLSLFHLQQGFFSGLLSHDIVQPHPHSHVSVFTILPVQVGFLTSVWSNSLGIWSVCSLLFVTRD